MGLALLLPSRRSTFAGNASRRGCLEGVTLTSVKVVVDLSAADECPTPILHAGERSLGEEVVYALTLASQIFSGLRDCHVWRWRVVISGCIPLGHDLCGGLRDPLDQRGRQFDRDRA